MQRVLELWRRLLREECGQDLLEYALLAAAIGAAGIALSASMQSGMGQVFSQWGHNVRDAWEPPEP
jgi:Flp pilus assembly pilin Flp